MLVETAEGFGVSTMQALPNGRIEVTLDSGIKKTFPKDDVTVLQEKKPTGEVPTQVPGNSSRIDRIYNSLIDEKTIIDEHARLLASLEWVKNKERELKVQLKANTTIQQRAKKLIASLVNNRARLALCDTAIVAQVRATEFAQYCFKVSR